MVPSRRRVTYGEHVGAVIQMDSKSVCRLAAMAVKEIGAVVLGVIHSKLSFQVKHQY
jgi:hypothetical protein